VPSFQKLTKLPGKKKIGKKTELLGLGGWRPGARLTFGDQMLSLGRGTKIRDSPHFKREARNYTTNMRRKKISPKKKGARTEPCGGGDGPTKKLQQNGSVFV